MPLMSVNESEESGGEEMSVSDHVRRVAVQSDKNRLENGDSH